MAIRNVTQRNAVATAYGAAAPYGALFTADPGTADAATNELTTTGSPAYARKAISWGTASASVITGAPVFDCYSGVTVAFAGVCVSSTRGTADVRDSFDITDQAFASQGQLTVTFSYTQS